MKLLFCLAALMLVTACLPQQATWYEDRCLQLGFKRGSLDFDKCVDRDRRWIEHDERRSGNAP